jgi:hydroxyethylthiazole kinase-like uncharacterized protein yjeF
MTIKLLLSADLRAIEVRHAHLPLMERAGLAAANVALTLLGDRNAPTLVLAGPGNNGGDAFVLARILHECRRRVVVIFRGNPEHLPPDARTAFAKCRATSVDFYTEVPTLDYALIVDGLFGIGISKPVTGDNAALIERINRYAGPVLALDIPSGLFADTGRVPGIAVRATHTATFIAAKPGLYTLDGPDHSGTVSVHDLGIPVDMPAGTLIERSDFSAELEPRLRNSHKGSHGALAVIGGAAGMTGAALLAARAGLMLGAGRVFVGLLEALTVDPLQPELMLRTPDHALSNATSIVIGPGLGQSGTALDILRRVVSIDYSLLLDADALNLVATHPVLAATIARRTAPTLLTPHPAEAARLLGNTVDTVQADRVATTCELAVRFRAHVALKGCGTVVASPDGRWWINATGNPGLASGGTGDVLAGITGALLAQGWRADRALLAAVHLHGATADALVANDCGPVGLTAGELIPAARRLLNHWIAECPPRGSG